MLELAVRPDVPLCLWLLVSGIGTDYTTTLCCFRGAKLRMLSISTTFNLKLTTRVQGKDQRSAGRRIDL